MLQIGAAAHGSVLALVQAQAGGRIHKRRGATSQQGAFLENLYAETPLRQSGRRSNARHAAPNYRHQFSHEIKSHAETQRTERAIIGC